MGPHDSRSVPPRPSPSQAILCASATPATGHPKTSVTVLPDSHHLAARGCLLKRVWVRVGVPASLRVFVGMPTCGARVCTCSESVYAYVCRHLAYYVLILVYNDKILTCVSHIYTRLPPRTRMCTRQHRCALQHTNH